MSEEKEQSQKTEEPTQKRLEDARKKGDVPKSQEVSTLFVLTGGALVIGLMAGHITGNLGQGLIGFIANPHQIRLEGASSHLLFGMVTELLAWVLLPVFGVLYVAAIAGNVVQHKPVFTVEKMKPQLKKISPLAGFKRLFSMTSLLNFAKGIAKMAIVASVVFLTVWPQRDTLGAVPFMEPVQWLLILQEMAIRIMAAALFVIAIIAALDYAYQRFQFIKRNRMTKQEIKDEFKQTEGDPHVKAKLRQIRAERGRQRMMAAVPEATVVITNPTHYAVALKYEQETMNAPVCVAKGVDDVALRIRAVAEENNVPIVENPTLARALHATVDIDDEVPPDHYKAVAQVIGYVLKLRRRARR